jgi:hypothetical protein
VRAAQSDPNEQRSWTRAYIGRAEGRVEPRSVSKRIEGQRNA